MPASLSTLIRSAILLLLCAHAFFMYSTARTTAETVGFQPGTALMAFLFAAVLMIPFFWAFGIADLPEIWSKHVRPQWRWRRGRCPACGYDRRALASKHCPECGHGLQPPPAYRYSWATVRRFFVLLAAALFLGSAIAETSMLYDEYQFKCEVRAVTGRGDDADGYHRQRMWPNSNGSLTYSARHGILASE